jgi:hypothetical protein
MRPSNSRHNIVSKVDHDKAFRDTNYRGPKNDAPRELPALQMDIRKRLASTHLSAKLSGKTPVTTVATGLTEDENEAKYFEQYSGGAGVLYDDEDASVASNHSMELEMLKKSPEQIKMENFMDELGKVGHVSDEESEDSYDSEDSYGEFVEKDRKHYRSTLDVHRKFMLKAQKKNTLSDIKSVAAVKVMTHKKKLAQIAQNQDLMRPSTGASKDNSEMTPNKATASAVAGTSPGSLLGVGSAAQSFMFLSKLTNGRTGSNSSSPAGSILNSPQITKHKTVTMAPDVAVPSPPAGSPMVSSPPKQYTASPGGYAYSSKHNLLHDPSLIGSGPNSPLPLFGKAPKRKQIAHQTFSATTLSALNSKFDTTHSVLSAARDTAAVVKVTGHVGAAMAPPPSKAGTKPLYHVPELQAGQCAAFLNLLS